MFNPAATPMVFVAVIADKILNKKQKAVKKYFIQSLKTFDSTKVIKVLNLKNKNKNKKNLTAQTESSH